MCVCVFSLLFSLVHKLLLRLLLRRRFHFEALLAVHSRARDAHLRSGHDSVASRPLTSRDAFGRRRLIRTGALGRLVLATADAVLILRDVLQVLLFGLLVTAVAVT